MRAVACGILVMAVATTCATVLIVASGCRTGTGTATGPKIYEREEFKAAVEGKSQDEVLKLLGKPDRTSDTGPDSDWDYQELTYDKLTGKKDTSVRIVFRRGVVHHMLF